MGRDLYRVYVDEAGDRGWGGNSSAIFNLSAVVMHDDAVAEVMGVRGSICDELGKPRETVLHWSENIKSHSARKFVSRKLADAPMAVTNVVVDKSSLMGSGTGLSDPARQYNYAVRRLLERISWLVDDEGGEAIVTVAHIRRFPYESLRSYLQLLENRRTTIRWDAIRKVRIDQPSRVPLLQIADLTAGCTHSAFRKDKFGDHEPSYLMNLAPRIYAPDGSNVSSYGINFIAENDYIETYPWWDEFCAVVARPATGPGRHLPPKAGVLASQN